MPAKTVHGARARVQMSGIDTNGNQFTRTIGIWNEISYTVDFDVAAVAILGRFSPAELVTTGVNPVAISASGYRIVNHGVYADCGITKLQDLLRQEGVTIDIQDRQTGATLFTVSGCVPTRHHGGYPVKALSSLSVDFLGLSYGDETTSNAENASSTVLP